MLLNDIAEAHSCHEKVNRGIGQPSEKPWSSLFKNNDVPDRPAKTYVFVRVSLRPTYLSKELCQDFIVYQLFVKPLAHDFYCPEILALSIDCDRILKYLYTVGY